MRRLADSSPVRPESRGGLHWGPAYAILTPDPEWSTAWTDWGCPVPVIHDPRVHPGAPGGSPSFQLSFMEMAS